MLVGDRGADYGSGSRNGFFEGRAYLFEGQAEAEQWAAESGIERGRTIMPALIRSMVEILEQLPPWDAAQLLTEAFEQIEDPVQRTCLAAIRVSMTESAAGVALSCASA